MLNYSPIYPYPNAYNQYVGQPQPVTQVTSGPVMAWVQGGMEGAKIYPVALNSRAYLFDSEEDCFYVKVVDDMGRISSFRKFSYQEDIIEEPINQTVPNNYVTRDEIKNIIKEAIDESKNSYRKGGHNNGKSFVRGTDESRDDRNVQ